MINMPMCKQKPWILKFAPTCWPKGLAQSLQQPLDVVPIRSPIFLKDLPERPRRIVED